MGAGTMPMRCFVRSYGELGYKTIRKLLSKQRVGAKLIKRYDLPQTPYQKLLASGVLPGARTHALEQQFLAINPACLVPQIDQTLQALWKLSDPR